MHKLLAAAVLSALALAPAFAQDKPAPKAEEKKAEAKKDTKAPEAKQDETKAAADAKKDEQKKPKKGGC